MGRSQQIPRPGDPQGPGGPSGRALPPEYGPDADDTGCPVLHVDMDAFFVSVEVRRRPELAGRPVVVGGTGPRGVVSSASYEARRYGIRSAMPAVLARRRCPQALFLPPDFAAYSEASAAIMTIFREITPLVEPLSLDEAFLDVSGALRRLGRPAVIAALVRHRVAAEQRLPCTVGVAPSKYLAKLASTRAKPDGLSVVPAARVLDYLHPLPVEALWGVGERSAATLRRLGLGTVGEVARAPVDLLRAALGEAMATHLHELAWARDPRPVVPDRADKSIGAETTFDTDVHDPGTVRRTLLDLSGVAARRLRHAGHAGRTVVLKVRHADFRTVSRSRTLTSPTDVTREIFETAWALYRALPPGDPVRLLGVRLEGLTSAPTAPRQLALGEPDRGWREVDEAADAALARFGPRAVRPASLIGPGREGRAGSRTSPQRHRAERTPPDDTTGPPGPRLRQN